MLFSISVTDSEAPWHTDGTSRDRVFDVTGLMCLQPGKTGGEYSIANACNAYASLVARMPRFILWELMRPLPREIVEKGKGKGSAPDDYMSNIVRSAEMLQLRILRNSFPIFELAGSDSAVLQAGMHDDFSPRHRRSVMTCAFCFFLVSYWFLLSMRLCVWHAARDLGYLFFESRSTLRRQTSPNFHRRKNGAYRRPGDAR